MPTYLSCPFCNIGLDIKNAFILNGNSIVKCPKCSNTLIVQHDVKCHICSRSAKQILGTEIHEGGAVYGEKVYNYNYFCALHANETLFNCPDCGKAIKKKFITIQNGIIKGSCDKCSSDHMLHDNITCDEMNAQTNDRCSNMAIGINWQSTLYRNYPFPHYYCMEHKKIQKKYGCLSSAVLIIVLVVLIITI